MAITVDDVAENVHAEDDEKAFIEKNILPQAQAFVNTFINRNDLPLDDDEELVKDRAVLFVATTFYLNRDGSNTASSLSKSNYAGLNSIFDSIRVPGLG